MSGPVSIFPRDVEGQPQPCDPSAGCRFSIYPMTDAYVSVIVDALAQTPSDGLEVVTDDVSTYLAGEPAAMLGFVAQTIVAVSRRTGHVAVTLLLSRGCPGEGPCRPYSPASLTRATRAASIDPTGIRAAAHFSLYPLGVPGYMEIINSEIELAKEAGLFARAEHFTSRLEGDLAEVLSAIGDSWGRADASHVVAHATISVGSPTRQQP
jgi:energy-coupling factor transport system substrate-specific component